MRVYYAHIPDKKPVSDKHRAKVARPAISKKETDPMSIFVAAPFWGDEYAVNACQLGEGLRNWWSLLRTRGSGREPARRDAQIMDTELAAALAGNDASTYQAAGSGA
jgi:hypothetical protein